MKDDQRASVAFELFTQVLQRKTQVRRVSFELEKADPGSLQHSLKAQLPHFGGFCDCRCRLINLRGQGADFCDGGRFRLGEGPKVLARVPDFRRRYGGASRLSEFFEMSFLRVETHL